MEQGVWSVAHQYVSIAAIGGSEPRCLAQKNICRSRVAAKAGPEAVLTYLARYTHRVAISNSRLIGLDDRGVTFGFKDYRRNGRERFRTMTLAPGEFISRFLLHVLPKGFHRIRHYGLLASATCKANIARARELMAASAAVTDPPAEHDDPDLDASAASDHRPLCPCCGGRMIIVESFGRGGAPRGPPSPEATMP
jgi:hypothetical protein